MPCRAPEDALPLSVSSARIPLPPSTTPGSIPSSNHPELLCQSSKMVEQDKNFKVLEAENTELQVKLETLTVESEKSVVAVMESSNHETVRLEKLRALRDKQLANLKKEFDIHKDLAPASASELYILRKEHAEWNHSVLAP